MASVTEAMDRRTAAGQEISEEEKRRRVMAYVQRIGRERAFPGAAKGLDSSKNREKSAAARAPEGPEKAAQGGPEKVARGAEKVAQRGQSLCAGAQDGQSPCARGQTPCAQPERTKPNRKENEFMLNLMVLRNTMFANAPSCRERAKRAGRYVWRDIRLLQTLVNRVQERLIQTMPKSREDIYAAYAQGGHYELHMDGPIRTPRHILVTDKHMGVLCEAAMRSECLMCMREGSEIGQCALREALLEVAAPTELQEGRWTRCEYRDAASQVIQGEEEVYV